MLKEYEVWMEGFLITGMEGIPQKASLLGRQKARTFKQACYILMCKEYLKNIEEYEEKNTYYDPDRFDFEFNRLSIWGCKLFDNEIDARKSFG